MSQIKERPILFSAPMVRAILDGRKTQTRRIVKAGPSSELHYGAGRFYFLYGTKYIHCPYGQIGERLWVRENFWSDKREPNECVIYSEDEDKFRYRTGNRGVQSRRDRANRMPFVGDEPTAQISHNKFWKQKPSIFMPRWASRITLEVTGVRVERLQEISEADAQAEGIDLNGYRSGFDGIRGYEHRIEFSELWKNINGPDSWNGNPWVWVVEFKRVEA